MKRMPPYSQMDPVGQSYGQDYQKIHPHLKLEKEVEVALIAVAGAWATELNKSKPGSTVNDYVDSFRDAYSSLVLNFLIPEK